MPNKKSDEFTQNRHDEMQKKLAAEEAHKRLAEENKKYAQAAMTMTPSRLRATELEPFKDSEKSKKLKNDNVGLQTLLDGFVTAISPIAPAISQILKVQRNLLDDKQTTSLLDIGRIFAKLPFDIADPKRSMKDNLDLFIGVMKKLTTFVIDNPEIIVGVATILFPALAPISGFLSKALGFLLSSTLAPALKEPLERAAKSAKKEVDLTESAIRDASKPRQRSDNPRTHNRPQS